MTRILLAAAGSGGHLYPALSFGEAIKQRAPEAELAVVSCERGEAMLRLADVPYQLVPSVSWTALVSWRGPWALWRMGLGAWRVARWVRRWRPQLAVGFGGYCSALTLAIAKAHRIPCMLHEQNVMPGLATQWASRWTDRQAVSFPATRQWMNGRATVVTGNPIRSRLLAESRGDMAWPARLNTGRATVLIIGGSQGARGLNRLVLNAWAGCHRGLLNRLDLIHLTGPAWHDEVLQAYRLLGLPARCVAFTQAMEALYHQADVVIARAGATTIAELAAFGLPAILVPYPAARAHQLANAQALAEVGACRIVEEGPQVASRLQAEVEDLLLNPAERARLGQAIRQFAQPDAAARLAALAFEVIGHP